MKWEPPTSPTSWQGLTYNSPLWYFTCSPSSPITLGIDGPQISTSNIAIWNIRKEKTHWVFEYALFVTSQTKLAEENWISIVLTWASWAVSKNQLMKRVEKTTPYVCKWNFRYLKWWLNTVLNIFLSNNKLVLFEKSRTQTRAFSDLKRLHGLQFILVMLYCFMYWSNQSFNIPPPNPAGIPRPFGCASFPGRGEFERCLGRVGNLNRLYLLFFCNTPMSFFGFFRVWRIYKIEFCLC